jgi:hypothetical protein
MSQMVETLPTFFHDNTYGLPDHWILDPDGKPSQDVLAEAMGIPRRARRQNSRTKAASDNTLTTYCSRWARLRILDELWNLNLRPAQRTRSNTKVGSPFCWETIVFGRFLPKWYSINASKALPLEPNDEPDPDAASAPEGEAKPVASEALRVVVSQVLRRLYAALDSEWAEASIERRTLLADVAFACYTVFGPSVLSRAAEKAPGILDFYRFAATYEQSKEDAQTAEAPQTHSDTAVGALAPHDTPTPESWETLAQLYSEIARVALEGATAEYDSDIPYRLQLLINVDLPRMLALCTISDDEVRDLLSRFTNLIVNMGKALELAEFGDQEFCEALSQAWNTYFTQQLQSEVESDFFACRLEHLHEVCNQALDQCQFARSALAGAKEATQDRRLAHEVATFRQKGQALQHLAEAEMHEAKCKAAVADFESEALHNLLPPEISIDELPEEGYTAPVNQQDFHPSARKALTCLGDLLQDTARALDRGLRSVRMEGVGEQENEPAQSTVDSEPEPATQGYTVAAVPEVTIDNPEPAVVAESRPEAEPTEDTKVTQADPLPAAIDTAQVPAAPAVEESALTPTVEAVGANEIEPQACSDVHADQAAEVAEYRGEYFDRADEAVNAFHCHFALTGQVPAIAVDNIAMHWLQRGHLNVAAATLQIAEQLEWVRGEVLPAALLRVAYFGLNVWPSDQASHANIQRQLNFLPHKDIDELADRRLAGKAVPYLLFAASLQATLFTGKYTMAPRILSAIAHRLDRATGKMLTDLVEFSDKGYRLDLESLRRRPQVDEKQVRARLLTMLSNWRDRIINKQTGWAPARKALRDCLSLPDFAATMAAIEADDGNRIQDVRDFVNCYSDGDTLHDLMMTQVAKAEKRDTATIESFARQSFFNSIGELVQIARDWVDDVQHRRTRGNDTKSFATRFLTQLQQARIEIKKRADNTSDIAQSAGAALALKAVDNLLKAIEGDSDIMWSRKRAEAFFALPQDLLNAAGLDDNLDAQLPWLVEQCERGLDWVAITEQALLAQDYRIAMLALLNRWDGGEEVGQQVVDVDKAAADRRHAMVQNMRHIRTMVDNAALSGLIDDERGYQLRSELEYLEESVDKLETLDGMREYSEQIAIIERDLEAKIGVKREELQRELQEQLNHARTQLGAAGVPDEWVMQVNRALTDRNLAVVDEMIDHLKTAIREGRVVGTEEVGPNRLLQNFLRAEPALYDFLVAHPNAREVAKHVVQVRPGDLDFPTSHEFKAALQGLVECRNQHRRSLDRSLYDTIADILRFLGIHLETDGFSQRTTIDVGFDRGDVFSRLSLNVKTTETGRAFPWFEPNSTVSQITVILACRDWQSADLKDYLDSIGASHQRTLLLSAKPLTSEARNALARESKKNQFALFHIDPVLMAFLGTVSHTGKPLRNFLQLSTPWTYYNPYTARDTLQPAPAEMVYGRQHDAQTLVEMGGAAIIYGGRQLGKSTLLQEAKRQFHKPGQQQYAFYRAMDRDMDRGRISKQNWERERIRVSQEIYRAMIEAKIVVEQPNIDPQSMINIVNSELAREGRTRILMCFDEIDPLLELDSANNFGIFRGLSDLVNQPSRRIKILIAGLQNVKRFEDAPNFPLPQLGRSLRISILDTADAIQLVCEPLHILGYQFEDPLLANRILAITNRHPGLIHIFCHELLRRVSRKPFENVGDARITSEDVDRVERDPVVTDLIRIRFEMTLNLDKRYLVIVYGLITNNRTTGSFTAAQAKEIAEDWLPAEFKHLTEKQFEAFLVELVGLGVLREKTNNGRAEYSLRNVNIMNLVGSARVVEEKLLRAVEGITQDNPLYGHAFPENATCPSPLTFKDEKFLLNPDSHSARELGDGPRMYSVGVICGSEALGLQADIFAASLPALGEFEENRVVGRTPPRYQVHAYSDTALARPADFARILESAITERSKDDPIMLLVTADGETGIAHTLDLLSVAHSMTVRATGMVHRVRVLFLLGPQAMWQWQSRPDLTAELELQQPFIGLERWNETGLSNLLNRLSLDNSDSEVDELQRYSHGWYFSLNLLAQKCLSRRRDAVRLADLKSQYVPIVEAKPRDLQKFLGKTGLTALPWGVPLATQLAQFDGFDIDDLQLMLMEPEFEQMGIDADLAPAVLRWLERLRVTDSRQGSGSGRAAYSITPSIVAALRANAAEAKA